MTTRSDIKRWIDSAPEGTTHMLVRWDSFDGPGADYPVYVSSDQDVREEATKLNTDKLVEVYSLTGLHSIESQLGEHRAFHYD